LRSRRRRLPKRLPRICKHQQLLKKAILKILEITPAARSSASTMNPLLAFHLAIVIVYGH
jgi:hypothetical protein